MSLSIITTVLNDEKFIYDCGKSVKNQNITKNYEHIVIDGGSNDNTLKILKKWQIINIYLILYLLLQKL